MPIIKEKCMSERKITLKEVAVQLGTAVLPKNWGLVSLLITEA